MEPFFDSCGIMRDVMISIMATLAEQERINISDRTKAGLERARKAGRVPGPKRADIDMDVVRKRQAKGESLRSIAKALGVTPSLLVKRAKAGEYIRCAPNWQLARSCIHFRMVQEEKGGSKAGHWILVVLLILAAAYIYFRR